MIRPSFFYEEISKHGTIFFTGVPDSLLKNLCAYITDNVDSKYHIIAANEGNAIGLAAGSYIATGKVPLVYLQNSGYGNIVNPILSMADKEIYGIPMIILIGWRGEPEVKDEIQHIKQGRKTIELLETMEMPYTILDSDEEKAYLQIRDAYKHIEAVNEPYAIVIKSGTFDSYSLRNKKLDDENLLTREQAIDCIISHADQSGIFVSTTGMASRELYELRQRKNDSHNKDFLVVGSMGHASSIAYGISLFSNKLIYCIDGDGAFLMHMGADAVIGSQITNNFCHIVINNGAHDSVGGQPTVAHNINLMEIAKGCKYDKIFHVCDEKSIIDALEKAKGYKSFIEVVVKKGNRANLGRPKTSTKDNLSAFIDYIRK